MKMRKCSLSFCCFTKEERKGGISAEKRSPSNCPPMAYASRKGRSVPASRNWLRRGWPTVEEGGPELA